MATEQYVNPSIGRVGIPYFDQRNNRIKYLSLSVFHKLKGVEIAMNEFEALAKQHGATRINARFFTKDVDRIADLEAKIPLNGHCKGLELVFVGRNNQTRRDCQNVLEAERRIVQEVIASPRKMPSRLPEGYTFERLTSERLNEEDVIDLFNLYQEAFTTYTAVLDGQSIRDMVENSIVYVARNTEDQNRIVSSTVAEIARIDTTDAGPFYLSELSEMATLKEHQKRGISKFITFELMKEASKKVDLMYAEARACCHSINHVFHSLGFNFGGALHKQCILSGQHDVSESGPYENLNVWYLNTSRQGIENAH